MKRLYIFRGLPGSGKSTLANKMAALVIEPDIFRYDADRRYVFDSSENDAVYGKTDELLLAAMSKDVKCLAIAATNVTLAPVRRYAEIGHTYGYDVTVVECYGDYGNVHDVPHKVIAKMAKEFEPLTDQEAERLDVAVRRVHKQDGMLDKPRTKWVALYIDSGDTCDGYPRSLGAFDTHNQAIGEIVKDMDRYIASNPGSRRADADPLSVVIDGRDEGCTWSAVEVEIK